MVSRESYGSLYEILCKVGTPKKTPLSGLSKNDFSPARTRGEESHLPLLFLQLMVLQHPSLLV